MEGLFAQNIVDKNDIVIKSYSNINKKSLSSYIKCLENNKIRVAKVLNISTKNGITNVEQCKIEGKTISQFLTTEAIEHKSLSRSAYRLFKKFIKYYFKHIYTLQNYSVDCKLSNFMIEDLILVDIVPILKNKDYNENKNDIKYVCYNKDCQIKNIITYWMKSFVCFSYTKNKSALNKIYKDFNKLKKFVEKFYTFKNIEDMNNIEKGYSVRFHLFEKSFKDYNDFKDEFLGNGFFKSLDKRKQDNIGKIYILGGSGVGKSYVSNIISRASRIDTLNLDDIYWKKESFSTPEEESVRDKALLKSLEKENIIVEGSYITDWVEPCFINAKKVFVVISDYKTQRRRIIARFLKRKFGIEKSDKKETIKSIKGLLDWSKGYQANMKEFVNGYLDKYQDKMIFVDDIKDILINLYAL